MIPKKGTISTLGEVKIATPHPCCVAPSEKAIAAASRENQAPISKLILVESATRKILAESPYNHNPVGKATRLSFDCSEKLVAVGTETGHVLIWRPYEGTIQCGARSHIGAVTALTFHPNGQLITGGVDASMMTWKVTDQVEPLRLIWRSIPILYLSNATFNAPTGLSPDNRKLLQQKGAKIIEETPKKIE